MKPQEIQVPGVMIQLAGLKAETHYQAIRRKQVDLPCDAGTDLIPSSTFDLIEHPNLFEFVVDTLVHMVPPPGTFGLITSRSSSLKSLAGGEVVSGIIDAGYTGEIKIRLTCQPDKFRAVEAAILECARQGIGIAQIIFIPCLIPIFKIVDQLTPIGRRGTNGFGSTNLIK